MSAPLHSCRTRCLDSTAMVANRLQDFIRAGAAAPLHIRITFCTARSDWFCRVHWVWRMQRPFHASDKKTGVGRGGGMQQAEVNIYAINIINLGSFAARLHAVLWACLNKEG